MISIILRLMEMLLITAVVVSDCVGPRKTSVMKDEIYDTIVEIVSGSFKVPVCERTRIHRAAIAQHCRKKNDLWIRLINGEKKLFYGKYGSL